MNVRPFRRLLHLLSPRDRSRRSRACRRLTIESLEPRELLTATFTVTSAGDNGNNLSPLTGSLRWAVVQADKLAAGTASTIQFAIPGGTFQTISLQAPLPQITTPATIDGTTQTGYTGTPLIELDGSSAGAGANGLSYASTASGTAAVLTQLKGLQIFSFSGAGVTNSGAAYLSLTNDYVGVQRPATYYLARGNTGGGVAISGGAHNDTITSCVISANVGNGVTITGSGTNNETLSGDEIGTDGGGVTIVDHNGKSLANSENGVLISAGANHNTVTTSVLSNNNGDGVELTGSGTSSNVVTSDHIGTDIFGMVALPNLYNGVEVTSSASANTVGGTTATARDVISGNTDSGVSISASATTTVVEGDFIGTDGTGTVAIPNHTGVLVGAGTTNTVGGTTAGSGDVISGNTGIGVWLTSGASKDLVAGDDIGTDLTGSTSVSNGTGVQVDAGSSSNTVGGTTKAARDVISGNTGAGVSVSDSGTNNNVVEGDYIGTDVTGSVAIGNGSGGILIANSAHGNTVGGTSAAARNIISGNPDTGVNINNGVTGTTIAGNYIGTDVTGLLGLPNQAGVNIGGGSTSNTIGGTVAGSLNVISANVHKAVSLTDAGTNHNVVEGNYLGTDATGTHALGNGGAGVSIASGAQHNTVGGTTAAARNVMAASTGNGVIMGGTGANNASTSDNLVEGNYIGTDKTGTANLSEGIAGVNIESGATDNTIGGTTAAARNILLGRVADVYIGGMGASDNLVEGNYLGTDVTGSVALGNNFDGILLIDGATDNTIGGTTAAARNIISGNTAPGVGMDGSGTTGNLVEGNYIGTDVSGAHALGNGDAGVWISDGASDNTIGGATAAAGNLISGNIGDGVAIIGPGSNDNVVAGNDIGTDATGTHALGNTICGIALSGAASNNTIGGTTAARRNVVSGNAGPGVYLSDSGTNNNLVEGDYIGTDATGSHALGNGGAGVEVTNGAQYNTVGGTSAAARNIISGSAYGLYIIGMGASDNLVEGDYIGTDVTGAHALGNSIGGVLIANGAQYNTVGGTSAAARNIISGNGFGVYIGAGGTKDNLVEGDYIGTDVAGTHALGNASGGVFVLDGASDNTIGGTTAAAGNVISGNIGDGVVIIGSGTNDNLVAANDIGTDATGTHALGNTMCGIAVAETASNNTIGGTTAAARNVISGGASGVDLSNPGTINNVVEGDYIGTDVTGTVAIGNSNVGVYLVNGASDNTVGGTTAAARDVISGNVGNGVCLDGSGTTGNLVEGDYIGTDVTGSRALGNGDATNGADGVLISDGASHNTVGGTSTGASNVISANAGSGVAITGPLSKDNVVAGDRIGTDAGGTHALGNSGGGVVLANATSSNTIGGTTAAARDVISGNTGSGVSIVGPGATGNLVEGDYVGTDATGSLALGNSFDGIALIDAASNNTIGGTTAAARNVISDNTGPGVAMDGSGTTGNLVEGDYIGTDASGAHALGNGGAGVWISGGAQQNTIGGTSAAARDVISGNVGNGVYITDSGTTGNVVTGDYIGTAANGTGSVGNSGDGVLLDGVSGNSITNSLICFNAAYGIEGTSGSNATNNTVTGDTFTVTIGTTTYGNKLGATHYH